MPRSLTSLLSCSSASTDIGELWNDCEGDLFGGNTHRAYRDYFSCLWVRRGSLMARSGAEKCVPLWFDNTTLVCRFCAVKVIWTQVSNGQRFRADSSSTDEDICSGPYRTERARPPCSRQDAGCNPPHCCCNTVEGLTGPTIDWTCAIPMMTRRESDGASDVTPVVSPSSMRLQPISQHTNRAHVTPISYAFPISVHLLTFSPLPAHTMPAPPIASRFVPWPTSLLLGEFFVAAPPRDRCQGLPGRHVVERQNVGGQ